MGKVLALLGCRLGIFRPKKERRSAKWFYSRATCINIAADLLLIARGTAVREVPLLVISKLPGPH
jgi:hypothetical protein